MKTNPTLEDRIQGGLLGAAIGSELGWTRWVTPPKYEKASADNILRLKLEPAGPYSQPTGRINHWKNTPIIDLGIRAYVKKQGRVTPEDFARELRDDREIARPVFDWDLLHTTQELLKEGCHPRLSGFGSAPSGYLVSAMIAVGIYHHHDPEYAYLDGVELASVHQPRLGADWCGLAAAAVAAAFDPDLDAEDFVDLILRLAERNNKDVYYELNWSVRAATPLFKDGATTEALNNWRYNFGKQYAHREINWQANNPLRYVLPLLKPFERDPRKLMALLLWANPGMANVILAGALVGTRQSAAVFPSEWSRWAEPIAKRWHPILAVVRKRQAREKQILANCAKLVRSKRNGMSLLEDKIYGCLLASSIGNAMGSVVEGMLYPEIDAKHPGGIRTVLEPKRLESEDDNQMAMHLVETYMERDGRPVMARHFGKTWYERLNRDHFYPMCMGNGYDLIRAGWDPRITGHWNQVTGSTVMCMEPVGIYHATDPDYASIDAEAISYMYQRGLDVTAAVILAATVAEALRPDATVDSICQAALTAAPRGKLHTFDQRKFKSCHEYIQACLNVAAKYRDVLAARKELYAKCLFYHMIDPLELLGLALAMFKIAKGDVRQAAIGGTNIGRDSDTIAGRAAMLSGTLRGSANVPREWIRMFKPAALQRIRHNARRLAQLITGHKLPLMQKRQA